MAEDATENQITLLGWRKVLSGLVVVALILGLSFFKEGLPAASWDNAVEWSAWIAMTLMGGNAVSHIAQAIGSKGKTG